MSFLMLSGFTGTLMGNPDILLAKQNMHLCLDVTTHAAVIDKGQIVYCAPITELRGNEAITRRYLAVGHRTKGNCHAA